MSKFSHMKPVLYVTFVLLWPTVGTAETTLSCKPFGAPSSIEMSSSDATSSDCGAYLDEAGQDATFCQWKFAYRAEAARAAFLDAETALDGCFQKTDRIASDVNHPDSYDQVVYAADGQAISLSLKDKAQHQSTYLFLRIETAP